MKKNAKKSHSKAYISENSIYIYYRYIYCYTVEDRKCAIDELVRVAKENF